MEPSTTKKKPKPIIAILAVVIPLLAIGIAAAVTTSGTSDGSATATTLVQDGDAEANAPGGGSKAEGGATKGTDGGSPAPADSSTTTKPTEAEPETPTSPRDTGTEGERTTVTYPQPTVPASGCSARSGTAVITLGSTPQPACLKLAGDQPVVVRNRTGKEISFVAISVNEVLAAGGEMQLGTANDAFGAGQSTFWSPGNPQLSGIVVVD